MSMWRSSHWIRLCPETSKGPQTLVCARPRAGGWHGQVPLPVSMKRLCGMGKYACPWNDPMRSTRARVLAHATQSRSDVELRLAF